MTESAGKEDPATQPQPLKLSVGAGGRQGGGTYLRPKDSNAVVGVRDRATEKALEGADRQTDRQTNFPRIIVRNHRPRMTLKVTDNQYSQQS